jgi:hypothetical protein
MKLLPALTRYGIFLYMNSPKSCQELTLKIHERGWQDFELNEQAFKMVSYMFMNQLQAPISPKQVM